jgi:hypothetical protein
MYKTIRPVVLPVAGIIFDISKDTLASASADGALISIAEISAASKRVLPILNDGCLLAALLSQRFWFAPEVFIAL